MGMSDSRWDHVFLSNGPVVPSNGDILLGNSCKLEPVKNNKKNHPSERSCRQKREQNGGREGAEVAEQTASRELVPPCRTVIARTIYSTHIHTHTHINITCETHDNNERWLTARLLLNRTQQTAGGLDSVNDTMQQSIPGEIDWTKWKQWKSEEQKCQCVKYRWFTLPVHWCRCFWMLEKRRWTSGD